MSIQVSAFHRSLFELEAAIETMENSLRMSEECMAQGRYYYQQMLDNREQHSEDAIYRAADQQRQIEDEIERFRRIIAVQRAALARLTPPSQDRRTVAA